MSDDIRIKRDTEVFFSLFQELVSTNLRQARMEVESADCDQLKEKIARIDAKVNAILALILSHSRDRMDLSKKIDIIFQSIESISGSFEGGAKGLNHLNDELLKLQSGIDGSRGNKDA